MKAKWYPWDSDKVPEFYFFAKNSFHRHFIKGHESSRIDNLHNLTRYKKKYINNL